MREFLSAQLENARRWLALAAGLGAMGTWAAIPVLSAHTNLPAYDIWLHIGSGIVLTASVAWLLLTRGSVLKFSIVLLMAEALLITLRMSIGFLTADPGVGISEILPPLSPWVPLIFVLGFMLLPLQEALYFSCVHMLVLMISAAVFITQAPGLIEDSYDMLNVALQYLCMHPLLVLILYLVARITHQQRQMMLLAYDHTAARARRLERDDRHAVLSRPGFLELLRETLNNLAAAGDAILVQCRLVGLANRQKFAHDAVVEDAIQKLLNCLKSATDTELAFGRMDTDSIMVLLHKCVHSDLELGALRKQLAATAKTCQPDLSMHVDAIRLERGMTAEIAFKTLELAVLQGRDDA
jgi:hypothetical protein